MRLRRVLFGLVPAFGVTSTLVACTDPPREPCPRAEPAFRVEITAPGGVPVGTRIDVGYQGTSSEGFTVGEGTKRHVDVCCRVGAPVSGPLPSIPCDPAGPTGAGDGGHAAALLCELWAGGEAEVRIEAPEFAPFTEVLEAEVDERCGVQTVDVRLSLSRGDGGA